MSMPSFPPCGADMTKDEALTMIVASIAMEELALSHILNAEGEKLQYILGTLPGGPKICVNPQEVLAVNKSVKDLLDTVMQNQILLRGKLAMALEAGGRRPGHGPEPPCPCGPERPCGPSHPDGLPCGELCGQKSAIHLVNRCGGLPWKEGFLLCWERLWQRGEGICWNAQSPALVRLDPARAYAVSYTINVRDSCPRGGAGSIGVRLAPGGVFEDVPPLHFSTKRGGAEPLTLHNSTMLFPQTYLAPWVDLSLILDGKDNLLVDEASLSIVEI